MIDDRGAHTLLDRRDLSERQRAWRSIRSGDDERKLAEIIGVAA